ncbi:hypothetical protein H1S01_12655 [Heliobacterium chlorum]|uniref:Uncharacterized protein n=1 Tax=Heliobacterium chlorum TaxID=2698 RepID=A0ABR7T3K4_HELCL|nr:hypothetical protein [Heliobacterium chlorum]MBC9785360.1 hypothetical protein [Heliobacterium chlorum]
MEPKLIQLKDGPETKFKEVLEQRKNEYYGALIRAAYLVILSLERPSHKEIEKEYLESLRRLNIMEYDLKSVGVFQ